MEKLLELLNEYEPYIATDGWRDNLWGYVYQGHSAVFPKEIGMLKIISKEYGFVKRLVENEKIDLEIALIGLESNDRTSYTETEELLMLLSIQDEPIRFLCEVIK